MRLASSAVCFRCVCWLFLGVGAVESGDATAQDLPLLSRMHVFGFFAMSMLGFKHSSTGSQATSGCAHSVFCFVTVAVSSCLFSEAVQC